METLTDIGTGYLKHFKVYISSHKTEKSYVLQQYSSKIFMIFFRKSLQSKLRIKSKSKNSPGRDCSFQIF